MHSNRLRRWMRAATVAVAFTGAGAISACEEFLAADNPAAIPVERLADTALVDLMANAAIAGVQGGNQFWYIWMGGIFTDELVNLHVFAEEGLWDQRRVDLDATYNAAFLYGPISRARWLADSVAGRIRGVYGDSALRDVRLARTYAMAGYNLIMLAEGFCEAPLSMGDNLYSRPYTTNELFAFAEARFDSAIKVAAASKSANGSLTTALGLRWSRAADSVRNLAHVGMARAALGRGDKAKAISAARQVTTLGGTTGFEYRAFYNSNTTLGLGNLMAERLSGGAGATSGTINFTPFIGLDDPRVPHPINATTGAPLPEAAQNGSWVVPNSPPSFSTFDGSRTGVDANYGTSFRIASLLEAQYIIAEAEGPTAANIAFVESRRTAFPSRTTPDVVTAANFFESLRTQRSRDFYLDGHRLGDLRRYEKQQGLDLWPKGAYPRATNVQYGTQKCWPITRAEVTNNPNVPKPYTPPVGP